MDCKYLSGRLTGYHWRVSLCPRSIHPMAVPLYSSASVVVGHYPQMKYIAATVAWSIIRPNQVTLKHSCLPLHPGVTLLHPAQASLEDSHGIHRQLSPPHIINSLAFVHLNRHLVRPINTHQRAITLMVRQYNNLIPITIMEHRRLNNLFTLNPPHNPR